ncbi:hypothetical protein NE237_005388 [Protea cynaroides]|uniref:Uncharacterized protein n=1 Tax=Protea cynaroides TaxID=273540 RepID=A0A9Q0KKR3_9MAGN|nr:hypothetical protein NE237_005388 [Protea cynaroides]
MAVLMVKASLALAMSGGGDICGYGEIITGKKLWSDASWIHQLIPPWPPPKIVLQQRESEILIELRMLKNQESRVDGDNTLILFEGHDGTKTSNGDVLIFPDMIHYRRLTHVDVDIFVEEVLVKDNEWLPGTFKPLSEYCYRGAGYRDVAVTATAGRISQIKALSGSVIGGEDILRNVMHHLLPNLDSIFKGRPEINVCMDIQLLRQHYPHLNLEDKDDVLSNGYINYRIEKGIDQITDYVSFSSCFSVLLTKNVSYVSLVFLSLKTRPPNEKQNQNAQTKIEIKTRIGREEKRDQLINLSCNDGDRRKSFPQRLKCTVVTTVVTRNSASPRDSVNKTEQALHCRHLSNPNPSFQGEKPVI